MIDSKLAIKAINAKLDSMSHDDAVVYLKSMGFSFKEQSADESHMSASANESRSAIRATFSADKSSLKKNTIRFFI